MKNIFLITLAFIAFISQKSFAQNNQMGRKTAEQRAEIHSKNMTDKLALSPEQKAETYEVMLKKEKLRDAGKLSKENQKEIHDEMNKILTKDQQKKWEQERKEQKNKKTD